MDPLTPAERDILALLLARARRVNPEWGRHLDEIARKLEAAQPAIPEVPDRAAGADSSAWTGY